MNRVPEQYFRPNVAVELVSKAILVFSFVGKIYCIFRLSLLVFFRDIGPGEVSGS